MLHFHTFQGLGTFRLLLFSQPDSECCTCCDVRALSPSLVSCHQLFPKTTAFLLKNMTCAQLSVVTYDDKIKIWKHWKKKKNYARKNWITNYVLKFFFKFYFKIFVLQQFFDVFKRKIGQNIFCLQFSMIFLKLKTLMHIRHSFAWRNLTIFYIELLKM